MSSRSISRSIICIELLSITKMEEKKVDSDKNLTPIMWEPHYTETSDKQYLAYDLRCQEHNDPHY